MAELVAGRRKRTQLESCAREEWTTTRPVLSAERAQEVANALTPQHEVDPRRAVTVEIDASGWWRVQSADGVECVPPMDDPEWRAWMGCAQGAAGR